MICPHCRKPIKREHTEAIKKKVLSLHAKGYSVRDIESLLERVVSFSTVAKWIRELQKRSGE